MISYAPIHEDVTSIINGEKLSIDLKQEISEGSMMSSIPTTCEMIVYKRVDVLRKIMN